MGTGMIKIGICPLFILFIVLAFVSPLHAQEETLRGLQNIQNKIDLLKQEISNFYGTPIATEKMMSGVLNSL